MKIAEFVKEPLERLRCAVNYSEWLEPGETLTTVEFYRAPDTAGGIYVDTYAIDSTAMAVIFFISAGLKDAVYELGIRASTSIGQIKDDYILFSIRE